MIMSRLFWLLRENDWLTRLSLYIFGVRALFFEWNFYSTHTQHRQTTWNCQIPRFWRNVWTSFPFYLSARRGFTILCCCCFFVDSSKGTDSARLHQQRCRVCVCLSPRLFNVFSPPFGIVYIFLFYVERLVVAVQVLKAFQSSGFFSRLMQIEERRVLSNFMKEKEGFFVGWKSRLENLKKRRA